MVEQPKDVIIDTVSEKINVTDKLKIYPIEGSTSFDIYDSQCKLPTDLSMMVLGGMGLEYIDMQQISILEPIIEGKFEPRVISGCFGDGRGNNNSPKKNIKHISKLKRKEKKAPNKENQNDTNLSFILPEEIKNKKKKKNVG